MLFVYGTKCINYYDNILLNILIKDLDKFYVHISFL